VLCVGARAAQIGTAFMRTREAGTAPAHREALANPAPTRLTRAFTGRRARGIVNRFLREHSADAPIAYPNVHHATAPLRAAGRKAGDADVLNLWAGQAHELAPDVPAAELVATLANDAAASLETAGRLLNRP
jgi:nitronate monooxygenase